MQEHSRPDPSRTPRARDPSRERRERYRYQILRRALERSGEGREPLYGVKLGEELGLAREETFRAIQYLAHHGFLRYVAAGPRVSVTPQGAAYLKSGAGRRRSVRDA